MNAELLEAIQSLDALARANGYRNIFQPGLAKELLIASVLGHTRVDAKHGHDAETPDGKLCEYLSCKEGGHGQIDRVFKAPPEKRARSLDRLARNDHVYLIIFDAEIATKILRIYELDKTELLAEMKRQLDRSKTDIAHVGFSEKFAAQVGKLVFPYK
jgi:hypothetical protein